MPKISAQTYAARRQHIIDAARERFAREGIHISIDEVCAAAGISKGAFYGYFRSKDALFEALAEDHGKMLERQNMPADGAAVVRMLVERLSLANPAYARLELDTWAYALRHAPLAEAFARNSERLRHSLAEMMRSVGPNPGLEPAVAASILQFVAQGAFIQLALNGSAAIRDIEAAVGALVTLLTDAHEQ